MRNLNERGVDPFRLFEDDERARAKKARASQRMWVGIWALVCVIDLLLLPLTLVPALFSKKVRELIATPVVVLLMMLQ